MKDRRTGRVQSIVSCGLVAAVLTIVSASAVRAQIVACPGVSEPGLKVLLDDIGDVAAASASPLMQPLRFRVEANLQQLKAETGLQLTVVRCARRRPQDPSEFQRQLVRDLNTQKVVLEVWGSTTQVTEGEGAPYHEASIGYLLVPIRFYEFDTGNPPGAFVVSRRTRMIGSADEMLKLLDQAGELAAYTAITAGTRALKAREYDVARTQLCKAELLLKDVADVGTDSTRTALRTYAGRLAGETVDQARKDGAYHGVLKALPISTSAGCATR